MDTLRGDPASLPRLLIVDDEYAVRAVLGAALRRQGFETRLAAGGIEALTLLRYEAGAFDLALIDLRMPGMDGLATSAALAGASPRLRCWLMTGGDVPAEEFLRTAGVAGVVEKPISTSNLAKRLHTVLSEDRSSSNDGTRIGQLRTLELP
jgi:CheY-like chemotaxis protein